MTAPSTNQVNEWLEELKQDENSPVRVLFESIQRHCLFSWDKVKSVECDTGISGGVQYDLGEVHICSNAIVSKRHLQETLSHELIHVFDMCRMKFDRLNCQQIACTEIRAAALSGDCSLLNEFFRGQVGFGIFGQFKRCVQRRATLALSVHPQCVENASKTVQESFRECINDTSPFNDASYVKYKS